MPSEDLPTKLPPVCYGRRLTSGKTVAIRRGENGYHPANTRWLPGSLNIELALPRRDRRGIWHQTVKPAESISFTSMPRSA
jgi:hypothetical protein